jgi:hypothetical protein
MHGDLDIESSGDKGIHAVEMSSSSDLKLAQNTEIVTRMMETVLGQHQRSFELFSGSIHYRILMC